MLNLEGYLLSLVLLFFLFTFGQISKPLSFLHSQSKKCPYSEFFWSAFSGQHSDWISVIYRVKMRTRKTTGTDTFHAAILNWQKSKCLRFLRPYTEHWWWSNQTFLVFYILTKNWTAFPRFPELLSVCTLFL